MKYLCVLPVLFVIGQLLGQDLLYSDQVYLPHIKSVKFHHSRLVTSEPIIDLNSRGTLTLTFDDILGGDRNYTYRIIHCDKDWRPSDLTEMEYIDGFNDEEIENYDYSVGTKYDYTNYKLILPNEDISWRISGNYLLVITDEDSDELAITRRFMVAENSVSVGARIDRSRKANQLLYSQEFDLTVDNQRYPIANPQNEVFITILQNGRWDNSLANIQPRFVIGDQINFDETSRPSFPGLNEFRGVDLRSVNTRGIGVYSIDIYEDEIDVLLETDNRRSNVLMQTFEDLNGDFIIENLEYAGDDDIRSEYVNVFFSLNSKNQILDGDVYVIGEFSDWQPREEFRLSYDPEKQIYHGSCLLKQGYYDYQYVILYDDGSTDIRYFEGSHYATSNHYHVLVYHRTFGPRYDKLIGIASISTTF